MDPGEGANTQQVAGYFPPPKGARPKPLAPIAYGSNDPS